MVRDGKGKIVDLAKAEGKSPEAFVAAKYEECKTIFGTAWALKVYPNTIRYWLKKAKLAERR